MAGKNVLETQQSYDFRLKIKDKDYSPDLYKVRIVSSLFSAYQAVVLNLFIPSDDIVLNGLYGKDPIKLSVLLMKQIKQQAEQIDFELMYVKSNNQMSMQAQNKQKSGPKDRTDFSIICVVRNPFKIMTSFVNDIFENKTVMDIIKALATKTGAKLESDSEEMNKTKIDQLIIPPTTLYKAIKYLDNEFGIYNGMSNLGGFCQYDGVIGLYNLSARINKSPAFTIYQIMADGDNKKTIDKCTDGKNFYTYSEVSVNYSGNSKFASQAKNITYISKPLDSLFTFVKKKLDDVSSKYGVTFQNKKIEFDPALASRTTYKIMSTGYEKNETHINACLAKMVGGMSTVKFDIDRNMLITNLMKVGQPVKFVVGSMENVDLAGKYILRTSDLNFQKPTGSWESTASVTLMRTNKTI